MHFDRQNIPMLVGGRAEILAIGSFSKIRRLSSTRPAGPMVRRLTTDQEIAGSSPA
ncbi:hypothetical protein BDQ94DRAFT_108775 [Aspergillus welwitschiae]|uniref:Uncharacterized protein n=1 Tax=Aspergillus welwitschiae TaxID=1341132 RepID=A0A3F3PLN3_9EURO|nr:hypothetical protein BDQ94DRAFT_108775 [Aspergillus welwitschiae]RDH27829.1 hypothetical protein BDQ94DRAFT_108775 [Aspergillus welwitschiae]